MKIKVIMTDKAMDRETMDQREKMLSAAVSKGVTISVDCIKKGPDELDCNTDEAFAAPELVKESIKAEQEGYDAIVIYCFSDVGIDAVRENVRIPVIGPGETSLCAASLLCSRFVVITTESANIPRTYRRLMRNGIAREKMTSVRALDIPIGELRADPGATARYLKQVCEKAVREEQADGVTLGCLLANLLGSTMVDVVFGTAATLIACLATYALRNVRWKGLAIPASFPPVIANALIVGAFEITVFFSDSAPTATMAVFNAVAVGVGEIISCCVLGVALVKLIESNESLNKIFAE